MTESKLNNLIDCSDLSSDQINTEIKNLIFNKNKHIILKNAGNKNSLLRNIKESIKIEIIGNVNNEFANNIHGLKVIVNGNIGDNSAWNTRSSKFAVFGSCGNNFASSAELSEFYIFENCGENSFHNLSNSSKVIIGGQASKGLACNNNGGIVVVLNLQGGSIFIDDNLRWFEYNSGGYIYLRGDFKMSRGGFTLEKTTEQDEDIYLPLISEFARQFNYSLSEIKSKQFYKVVVR